MNPGGVEATAGTDERRGHIMQGKELNGTLEGADQEKAVIYVKAISENPDRYDSAQSGVQYIVDGLEHDADT